MFERIISFSFEKTSISSAHKWELIFVFFPSNTSDNFFSPHVVDAPFLHIIHNIFHPQNQCLFSEEFRAREINFWFSPRMEMRNTHCIYVSFWVSWERWLWWCEQCWWEYWYLCSLPSCQANIQWWVTFCFESIFLMKREYREWVQSECVVNGLSVNRIILLEAWSRLQFSNHHHHHDALRELNAWIPSAWY